jgi:glycerophosphoryl diester phosphodiesterase
MKQSHQRHPMISLILSLGVAVMFATHIDPINAQTPRVGNHEIAAHAGDREAMPPGWNENEWENSIQAIYSAFIKRPRWVEIDVFLNTHPSAITPATPHGILFVHHNNWCRQINTQGQPFGNTIYLNTDDPKTVRLCAERLDNLMAKFPLAQRRGTRFLIEMKPDDDRRVALPNALYHLLKQRGERTSNIVSSMSEEMLSILLEIGRTDREAPCSPTTGCTMPLMYVYNILPAVGSTWPNTAELDRVKTLGFRYVAANVNNWKQNEVNHAKKIGLYTAGWHWIVTSPADANRKAVEFDLDIMITDSINDFRANYPTWK